MNESAYALFQQIKNAFRLGDFPPFTNTSRTPELTGGWMWDCLGSAKNQTSGGDAATSLFYDLSRPYWQSRNIGFSTNVQDMPATMTNINPSSWQYHPTPFFRTTINHNPPGEDDDQNTLCPVPIFSKLSSVVGDLLRVWSVFERTKIGLPIPYSQTGYGRVASPDAISFLSPFVRFDVPNKSSGMRDGRLLPPSNFCSSPFYMFDRGVNILYANNRANFQETPPKTTPWASRDIFPLTVVTNRDPYIDVTRIQSPPVSRGIISFSDKFMFVREIGGVPYKYSLEFTAYPHIEQVDGSGGPTVAIGFAIRVIPTFGEDH